MTPPCLGGAYNLNTLYSAANKGRSMVNHHQPLVFDYPYLSCNDHCDWWLFQEIFLLLFLFRRNLELAFLELLNNQNSFLFVLESRRLS